MEYRVLGPLEVAEEGHVLEPGTAKERTLLAVLLLHANEPVSTERLIDELWGDDPPRSAAKIVSTYVWQLRKTLGDAIVTRPPGYLAAVAPDRIDADRFAALVERAQGETPEDAADTLREALGLWRGAALADVSFGSFARLEVERLEDQRLSALARRIDHDLALGRHEAVLPELQALMAEHPYRERFRAQLMLALYRCGRQADALDVYRDARRRFSEELGLEPGPELQRLERAILDQAPELEAPLGRSSPDSAKRLRLVAAGLVALAGAAAVAGWLLVGDRSSGPAAVGPNAVAIIDPATGNVVGGVPVGIRPGALAVGADGVWVANVDDGTVSRIDPRTRHVAQTVPVGGAPTALAASNTTLWIISKYWRTLTAVDLEFGEPRSRNIPKTDRADPGTYEPTSVVAAAGHVRLADDSGSILDGRGRRWAAVPYPATDLTYGAGALWVVGTPARGFSSADTPGIVYRLDPASATVEAETTVGRQPNGIAVGLGFVWVVDTDDGTLERLDPVTGASLETIKLGKPPIGIGPVYDPMGVGAGGGIAVGEHAVWVTDGRRNALIRYEPSSGRITRIPLDAAPADIAVGHGLVWVTLRRAG